MISKIEIVSGERTVTVRALGLTRRQHAAAERTALALFLATAEPRPAGPARTFGFGPVDSAVSSDLDFADDDQALEPVYCATTPVPQPRGRATP